MKQAALAIDEREDLAPVFADMLAQASKAYAQFWKNLENRPSTDEGDRAVCEMIRGVGMRFATFLAYINQMGEESTIDLDGRPFPPPQGVLKAFRELQNNYTFMATVQSYDDLLNQPLVSWDSIRAQLDAPESREWMKTALAAY